jgi:hypothetical protein
LAGGVDVEAGAVGVGGGGLAGGGGVAGVDGVGLSGVWGGFRLGGCPLPCSVNSLMAKR